MNTDYAAVAWTQAWQVTALIAAVAVVTRWAASRRPQLAFLLWMIVFVKCVTPPLWSSSSGVFCWLQPRDGSHLATAATPNLEASPRLAAMVANDDRTRGSSVLHVGASSCWQLPSARWSFCIAMIWIAGIATVVAATAWRWRQLAKLLRQTGSEDQFEYETMSARLARRLGVRRPVRLALTHQPVGPAVLGLFRPTVLLPRAVISGKSADDVELMLAHELIHIRRGDGWFGLLRWSALALWWFHPLVWWAAARASREAERCCDEAVLAELRCSPSRYARCLIDILDRRRQLVSVPAFPGVRAMDVTRKRLERIMKIGERGYRRTPWWCWGAAIVAAAVVLPGAAIGIREVERNIAEKPAAAPASDAALSKAKVAAPASTPTTPPPGYTPSGVPIRAGVAPLTKPDYDDPLVKPDYYALYSVQDILSRIQKEQHLDLAESKVFLVQALKSCQTLANQAYAGTKTKPVVGKATIVAWAKGTGTENVLEIGSTRLGHQRIVETLDAMRKYGTTLMTIRVHFVAVSGEGIRQLGWTALPADVPAIAAKGYGSPLAFPLPLSDRSFESNVGAHPNRAQSIVETDAPLLYKLVDKKDERDLFDRWQSDKRTNILQSPKLTVLNGQSAFVSDCAQTPVVVGVKDGRPQIRMLHEGTTIQLRPTVNPKGELRLDFLASFAGIRQLETSQSSDGSNGKPVTVQVPKVETTRLEGGLELPWNSRLVLYGGQTPITSNRATLCLVICVEKAARQKPEVAAE
jgi:beta-lactamase regulating signal transducer with metallopeptidase domain